MDNKDAVLKVICVQSRRITNIEWSIQSIDIILGLVGGVSGIIWAALGLLIAPYEDFKFNNSLIGMIYPTAPMPDENEPPIDNRKQATDQLEQTVSARGKFYYLFAEYWATWFLLSCCCCFLRKNSLRHKKRMFKYERYNTAVERMNEEIDILKHIQN